MPQLLAQGGEPEWFRLMSPERPCEINLVCFPYAGGSASVFRRWHCGLPDHVAVYGLEMPGRSVRFREPLVRSSSALIPQVGAALLAHIDGPFAFFGYSMGAILAFETARWLREMHGVLPIHLYVAAMSAPHLPAAKQMRHTLGDESFWSGIKHLNGTPEELANNAEFIEVILPILRADVQIVETYTYTASRPLSCPITALAGSADRDCPSDTVVKWRAHTSARFRFQMFSGQHFFIRTEEQAVLQLLSADLAARG